MKKISFIPIALISLTPTISMVGCGEKDPKVDITVDLTTDKSTSAPCTESQLFSIEANKTYRFNINANICSSESFEYATGLMNFFVYKESGGFSEKCHFSVLRVKVGKEIFKRVQPLQEMVGGEYFYKDDLGVMLKNHSKSDSTFTMSVYLQFNDGSGENAIARWFDGFY